MNGEANQEKPPLLLPATTAAAVSGAGDRLKRDEWSEGAVSSLLEAYEAKWVLRNRAKLKGQDWEDVARHVSSRANQTKSPKTQTQCKNKIESMKKRYRSESAAAEGSSWPLYPRLDHLLRGNAAVLPPPPPQQQPQVVQPLNSTAPLLLLEPSPSPSPARAQPPPPQLPMPPETTQMSNGSNGIGRIAKEDGVKPKFPEQSPETAMEMETDSSTPAMYRDSSNNNNNNNNAKMKPRKAKSKKRPKEEKEIAGSIRWLGKVVMRSERARMETMKEIEKMRAEAETKRGEIDLKRTEIIANTQLEIAKIFAVAASGHSKGIDSSLRIGRN